MLVNRIKKIAQQELSGADKQLIDKLWNQINSVFQKWKLEHGDRNPKIVSYPHFSGLKRIPFEDVKPWECAGLESPSLIGITLKLWYEKYPEFLEIVKGKDAACKALALLITETQIPYGDFPRYAKLINDDLYDALKLLIRLQNTKPSVESANIGTQAALYHNMDKIKAQVKQQKIFSMGNPAAAKNKKIRADKYHSRWRKWAKEILVINPFWEIPRAAKLVLEKANNANHKMVNKKPYKISTIIKVITGVKKSLKPEN